MFSQFLYSHRILPQISKSFDILPLRLLNFSQNFQIPTPSTLFSNTGFFLSILEIKRVIRLIMLYSRLRGYTTTSTTNFLVNFNKVHM